MIALCISYAAVTVEFVATTNPVFFGGKFLNGFAVGALATITVSYIGEVGCCPIVQFTWCCPANAIKDHSASPTRSLHLFVRSILYLRPIRRCSHRQ